MGYRIFFSGLMFFVKSKSPDDGLDQVDVLLLNPCDVPKHQHSGGEKASCDDRHCPELMVQGVDIAEWQLPGTLHGCGWRHFDLTGKTVFTKAKDRAVTFPSPEQDEFPVYPFGTMRHVSFSQGIVHMASVLDGHGENPGSIDRDKVDGLLKRLGSDLIAARVRLPKGELTALAPLDNSPRSAFRWNVGNQELEVLGETVMFVPDPGTKGYGRIDLEAEEFVTLKKKTDVTVWITNEPLRQTRDKDIGKAHHFEHYYDLLPTQEGSAVVAATRSSSGHTTKSGRPTPILMGTAANIDNPLCPPADGETTPPLP